MSEFSEEYEQWVAVVREDRDWTGQDPAPGSTLTGYIEDHRALVTFMDYGGKRRWDGFHTATHPSPSLSEPGDYAADRLLARGLKKPPRDVGESTPDWPSRKETSTFDVIPRKQRVRQMHQMRHRRDKKVLRRMLGHGESQLQAAKYAGTSRTTVRRVLAETSPELLSVERERRAAMLAANSKWGWLIQKLLIEPNVCEFETAEAPKEAARLRPMLNGHREACAFRWAVLCISKTRIRVTGVRRSDAPPKGPAHSPDGEGASNI